MNNYSGGAGLQKPHPEGKIYDPEGYEKIIYSYWIGNFIAFMTVGLAFIAFAVGFVSLEPPFVLIFFISLGVIFIIFHSYVYDSLKRKHEATVSAEKERRNTSLANDLSISRSEAEEAKKLLAKQMKEIEKIQAASRMGDVIINGNKAPVFISSNVVSSFNTIATDDPELASAIKTLGGYIEESGNKDAAQFFNEFHEKIAAGDNNKTVLKALWTGIESALPSVLTLTDVVSKIKTLFD